MVRKGWKRSGTKLRQGGMAEELKILWSHFGIAEKPTSPAVMYCLTLCPQHVLMQWQYNMQRGFRAKWALVHDREHCCTD